MNYREHLWTPAEARQAWSQLLPYVDVLVTNGWVSQNVFGYEGSDAEMAARYTQEFGCRVVCLTSRESKGLWHGAWNSLAVSDGQTYLGQRVEFEAIDRFGTGDAWFAGFLYGYLQGNLVPRLSAGLAPRLSGEIETALNFGNTLCALAHTIEGDIVHVSADEVRALWETGYDLRIRR
jgi:2-dehydro-3-deoxygluconokinase